MASLAKMITQLEGLLGTDDLTSWEQGFVRDVAERTALDRTMMRPLDLHGGTPDKVEQIYRKHFA